MYQLFIKRILDFCFSLLGLALLIIILVPIAFLIKREDGGSIFYHSERWGKNMKPFTMYKFRSMKEDAPDIRNEDGTTYSSKSDPRQTKVGSMLRKTSIDELPQFINVLNGSMSLIGPRPSPPGDKSMYPEDFFLKYKVRPGITGYNQATLRNSSSMEERIKIDAYYVNHVSFILDMRILIWTVKGVIRAENINRTKS